MTTPITAREALEAAADLLESEAKKLEVRAFTRSINCRAQARQCRDAAAALSVQPAREGLEDGFRAALTEISRAGGDMPADVLLEACKRVASAALSASPAPVETGWKLVPIEPTNAMHEAARDWSSSTYGKPIGTVASYGCWRAMLDAAPATREG